MPLRYRHGYAAGLHRGLLPATSTGAGVSSTTRVPVRTATQP